MNFVQLSLKLDMLSLYKIDMMIDDYMTCNDILPFYKMEGEVVLMIKK